MTPSTSRQEPVESHVTDLTCSKLPIERKATVMMKRYPYLSADEAAAAAGEAAAMATAAHRSGAAASALCQQYGVQPSAADPRVYEDTIWHTAGGTPNDLPPVPGPRRNPATVIVALVAVVAMVVAATVIWQQERDLDTLRATQQQRTVETDVRRTAERFVTSYLLGAVDVSCGMEGRQGEDLRRCVYWQGSGGSSFSSVPTATTAFPYQNGWAVLVQFRLSGKTARRNASSLARPSILSPPTRAGSSSATGPAARSSPRTTSATR